MHQSHPGTIAIRRLLVIAVGCFSLVGVRADDLRTPTESRAESLEPKRQALDPQLRDQLLVFAPTVALNNRLSPLGSDRPNTVAEALAEYAAADDGTQDPFGAHSDLQSAYRDVRAFLVNSRPRITPALQSLPMPQITIDPLEAPELALAVMFLQMAAEVAKHEAVRSWCVESDQLACTAYKRIMPLLRQTSPGRLTDDNSVDVTLRFTPEQWVYLEAVNTSGKSLTNVSLHLELETLNGNSSDHYYFLPKWAPEHRQPLRIASDWASVGAHGTTSASVDIVSDEIIAENIRRDFGDNIPIAADQIMNEAEAQLRTGRRPKLVIDRMNKLRRPVGPYRDRVERLQSILDRAKQMLDTKITAIDKKIEAIEARIEDTKDGIRRNEEKRRQKSTSKDVKKQLQQKIERLEQKLAELRATEKQLKSERQEWMRGER